MTKLTRRAATLGLAATPLALATPAMAATKHKISILGMRYRPAELTIKAGDSVRWSNDDDMPHTATDRNGNWDTGTMGGGRSKTVTFAKPGTYDYFCTFHTNMSGRIIVA